MEVVGLPQIPSLTALTTLTDDDLFVVVDTPSGAAAARKITAANVKSYAASVGTSAGTVAAGDDARFTTVARNRQTGTTYTLVLTDAGGSVEMSNASVNTVTVPPSSSVAFPTGTVLAVGQYGAGTTTIVAGSGVTLRSRGGLLALAGQYAVASVQKIGGDEWWVAGDLV